MTERAAGSSFCYRLSGLAVASPVALAMAPPLPADTAADVTITLGAVPDRLEPVGHHGANWQANGREFLLELPGLGRMLAADGDRLVLAPLPGVPAEDLEVFVTGPAFAALLYQRGGLLLHGSAVVHDGRAHVFCGPSGAGKSTLAAALCRAGCAFLVDDLALVDDGAGTPQVVADGRVLRLHGDSIGATGLGGRVGGPVRRTLQKFHVDPPVPTRPEAERVPLAGVYLLRDADPTAPEGLTRLDPVTAAQGLLQQAYRRPLALAYGRQGDLVRRTAALLAAAGVHRLVRHRDLDRLADTADRLVAGWCARR